MWILLTVPFMIVGCAIAIVPVLAGSIRDCRSQRESASGEHEALAVAVDAGAAPRPSVEVVCPPCGAVLRGADTLALLVAVSDHAWRAHGVPDAEQLRLTAQAALAPSS